MRRSFSRICDDLRPSSILVKPSYWIDAARRPCSRRAALSAEYDCQRARSSVGAGRSREVDRALLNFDVRSSELAILLPAIARRLARCSFQQKSATDCLRARSSRIAFRPVKSVCGGCAGSRPDRFARDLAARNGSAKPESARSLHLHPRDTGGTPNRQTGQLRLHPYALARHHRPLRSRPHRHTRPDYASQDSRFR